MSFLEKTFHLNENGTNLRTELLAGLTTFLTMAYIIFLQPAILSGSLYGTDAGMDFGAVMTGTCISAVIATVIMALYARYPIALAPGIGGVKIGAVFTETPLHELRRTRQKAVRWKRPIAG